MITFRQPKAEDRGTIMEWIADDPDHREINMSPDEFYKKEFLSMVVCDDDGKPGYFIRIDPEKDYVRLHVQFSPNQVTSIKTMLRSWPELSQRIWATGVKRMVFESKAPRLIAFCSRVFGFRRVGETRDYELVRVGD